MTEKIYIQINNERIEATGETLDYILESQAKLQTELLEEQTQREAKEAARTSALAKLAALGLTEEEIAAL